MKMESHSVSLKRKRKRVVYKGKCQVTDLEGLTGLRTVMKVIQVRV